MTSPGEVNITMTTTPMQIGVFCHAKFRAFHTADQLHKRGVLERLYTPFYGRFGGKRNDIGLSLPKSRVKTNLLMAVLFYGYNPGSDMWRHRRFGAWAAQFVDAQDIVISWGLSALPIIERAHERGIVAIVERGSAHAAVQRDLLIEEYERYGESTVALRASFSAERMERELHEYALADYIRVPSQFAARTFVAQGVPADKMLKSHIGVDLSLFRELPKPDGTFRVIYTGQMSLRKGVHYLLQAFAELDLLDAELWLFGSHRDELTPFFAQYEGHYRYFGAVPQAELHKHYAYGDLFAICSIEEGLAMVQPQAMACGLPVLCTTNTGGEDIINDGVEGFIVPIRDVEAIKAKILYCYENREACRQMGQAAKRRVENGLSWDDSGGAMTEQFRGLLTDG
jgi:glycosyltransferase involved in cell wall biosynthesis